MAKPQIIDSQSPMSVLLDEKFTEVHTFNSPLAQIDKLSVSFLATVSDDDIEAYEEEIVNYAKEYSQIQKRNLDIIQNHVAKLIGNMYGSQSKQYKYMMRNFSSNHEIPCLASLDNVKSVDSVREVISDARKANKSTSSVVLADRDVSQIDSAIQFLTQNGYEYGKDFNASNVVNIAKSVAIQDLTNKEFSDIVASGENCSELCASENHDAMVKEDIVRVECACGEYSRNLSIGFVKDTTNVGQYKYELEEIANG